MLLIDRITTSFLVWNFIRFTPIVNRHRVDAQPVRQLCPGEDCVDWRFTCWDQSRDNKFLFPEDQILYWSRNKKDCEKYLATKKYNL